MNLQENKNLSKVKHCSKGYLFWYQTFDSLDILISAEVSLILRNLSFIKKIDKENSFFNEPVWVQKVEGLIT